MTKRQLALLRFIQGYQEAKGGVSPLFREAAVGIGLTAASKATVSRELDRLQRFGRLHRLANRDQAIEVLRPVAIPRAPDGRPLYFVEVRG